MRLPAFGYMRIAAGTPENATGQFLREALGAYAERAGYALAEVFVEREESRSSAFAALMDALYLSERPVVIVPSLCHFAHLPGLRLAMKQRIERETGALVIVMNNPDPDETTASGDPATADRNDSRNAHLPERRAPDARNGNTLASPYAS
jgi:hypothetical protein